MKRPVTGRRSRYVRVSNFKDHCSDFRISCRFPFFRTRYPAILWRVGFYSPSDTHPLLLFSHLFVREVGSTHPRTHVHYSSLFYAFLRGVFSWPVQHLPIISSLSLFSPLIIFFFSFFGFSLFFYFLAVPFLSWYGRHRSKI
jgi:hypothetical protein